jgi:hypothetical protein
MPKPLVDAFRFVSFAELKPCCTRSLEPLSEVEWTAARIFHNATYAIRSGLARIDFRTDDDAERYQNQKVIYGNASTIRLHGKHADMLKPCGQL